MSENNTQTYFVGALITSALGGLIILFSDFASWYNYGYSVESWGYIYADFGNPLVLIIIGIVAALLFFSTFIAFLGIQRQGRIEFNLIFYAFYSSLLAAAIVVIGALVFVIAMLMDEPTEWGFDFGFFGGLIGGVMTAFFFNMIRQLETEKMIK